ncbi:hypothetical protein [Niabella ginsengisoli]|uniref:Response regulatory domain-containing protein n=1 Tax=Niabella ginsengisoli TaxID=522298 RepID=A0ABS9SGM9_9BACT|nr:hypothetical protein [Niabella ginsengisoli]MCH5597521.1 hypothetical protein [Niabella ginsengisoli]
MKRRILVIEQDVQIFEQVLAALLNAGFNEDVIDRKSKLDSVEVEGGDWGLTIICIHTEMEFEVIQSAPEIRPRLIILSDALMPDLLEAKGWNCLQLRELQSRRRKYFLSK